MNQINIKTLEFQKDFLIEEIKEGKIFIYPTDTILGIGCNAADDIAVKKIFEIKKRDLKPTLVIAPNKEWIYTNCEVNEKQKNEIETKLPGPVSFILKLKKEAIENNIISKEVLCGKNTIGVRIPNSKFTFLIEKLGIPFVTTSVNISDKPPALKLKDISDEILSQVDYVVSTDEILSGTPSSIFDLTENEIKQLR
jgi:L-threonylcarbamoyladenylate synthase